MNNFAILDIEQVLTRTGYIIILTTSTPCHLYMKYTITEPEKHRRQIFRRGIRLMDAIRYCFVTWHENEQEEYGDTSVHTFIKEPWPSCETRWFTFKGTINGQPSPSVGPIFKKHRQLPEWWQIIQEEWHVTFPFPPFTSILEEEWTTTFQPPHLTQVIQEEWSS